MADSDGEYVADAMSDDDMDHVVSGDDLEKATRRTSTSAAAAAASAASGRPSASNRRTTLPPRRKNERKKAAAKAWEQSKRTWETDLPDEDQDGVLQLTALDAQKRRRLLRDTTPLQRGIIRHLVLVLDMSFAMADKDMLPTRMRLTLAYAAAFVRDYFEQNPISQLGIVGMRDGVAVRVSDLGGNPSEHLDRLRGLDGQDPQGNPSLQNALEMCRGALFHAPFHGTREVLIIYGALLSSDPGDIRETMAHLVSDRIRVSVIGLSAHLAVCADLCARTNAGDESHYRVALDEVHFRELFLAATTPPVTRSVEQSTPSLLMMGFPSRPLAPSGAVSYCACHSRPCGEGYACSRCAVRVCRLPAECPACGLTLILSTHLARSYHHLFPLRNWVEVSWAEAVASAACFACQAPFPEPPPPPPPRARQTQQSQSQGQGQAQSAQPTSKGGSGGSSSGGSGIGSGVSESSRYACEVCGQHFCIDCDVFAHNVVHNCPGCQSSAAAADAPPPLPGDDDGDGGRGGGGGGQEVNGYAGGGQVKGVANGHGVNGHGAGPMEVDA